MGKQSVHLEEIIILSIYAHNTRASRYMKQKWAELQKKKDTQL